MEVRESFIFMIGLVALEMVKLCGVTMIFAVYDTLQEAGNVVQMDLISGVHREDYVLVIIFLNIC